MKGVFGLLLIIGGALLAWLVITGKIHLGSTTSASGSGSNTPPSGPAMGAAPGAATVVATPGSTSGGQQP